MEALLFSVCVLLIVRLDSSRTNLQKHAISCIFLDGMTPELHKSHFLFSPLYPTPLIIYNSRHTSMSDSLC